MAKYITKLISGETMYYLKDSEARESLGNKVDTTDSRLSDARPASNTVDTYSSTGTDPVSGKAVAAAIGTLDVSSVGGTNKYIKTISETNGKISATAGTVDTSVTADSSNLITSGAVKAAIDALPEPMVFKGSLGTGGTVTSLPTAAAANKGFTYKVITAGTYASQTAKVGDTFISDGSAWVLIPSGDEPSGTVTSVTIKATSPISIDSSAAITSSGTRTISHAASGVTAGTYKSVTVDAKGHVTAGTNPTTLAEYGITNAAVNKSLTNEDLNNITTPGFYNSGGSNTVTNKPNGVTSFGLEVIHSASGSYYTQIIYSSADAIPYRRSCLNGTWSDWVLDKLTDTKYSAATTSAAGLMSAADKTKLNGIATGANAYSLPTASSSTLGGIKVGTNLSISDGVLSATNTTYSTFVKSGSSAAAGLVPKPSTTAGTTKFLREDATWATPAYLTIGTTSTTAAAGNHTHDARYMSLVGGTGTAIESGTDLNTLLTAGTYYCSDSEIARTLVNTPHTGSNFKLIVQYDGLSSYGRQIVYVYTGATYVRSISLSAVSGSWKQVAYDVPSWALASSKPSYAFSEITGTATASQLPAINNLTRFSTYVYSAQTSHTANTVLAAPNGSAGTASFRALVAADIPSLAASKITSGTFAAARIPDLSDTYATSSRASTLEGYFTDGNAKTADQLVCGVSYDGGKGVTNPYHLVGEVTVNGTSIRNTTAAFFVDSYYSDARGILVVQGRVDRGSTINSSDTWAKWIVKDPNVKLDNFILTAKATSSSLVCRLYHKITVVYKHARFRLIDEGLWGTSRRAWLLFNTSSDTAGDYIMNAIPADETLFVSVDATVFTGATSSTAGKAGSVPAPAAGDQAKFLRGDGTWVVPTNTTYSAGTLALYNTGTDTANRVWPASVLKSIGNKYLPLAGGTMTGSVDFGNKKMTGVSDIDGIIQLYHYPNPTTPTNDAYACRVHYKDVDNCYIEIVNSLSSRGLRYYDSNNEENLWMIGKDDGDSLYVGDGAVVTTVRGENARLLCVDGSTAHYCFLANKQGNACIGEYDNRVYTYKLNVVGAVGATGYNNTSDIRKKDIIENVDLSVEDIANAPIFKFLWLDPEMDRGVNIGSSAQYWQTILPEIVSEADDDEKTLSMQYGVAALTSSVTLAKKVVEQEKTIKAQEERIKALEDAILEILSKLNN